MIRILALLFAFAAAPVQAAEGWEKFFELSFGDLRAEVADAKKDGKLGVVVMYHFEECPACARMKREVLSRPEVQAWLRVTHVGAIYDPAEFILLGEYVVAGGYVNTSFNAYKQSKKKRGS